MSKYTTGELAKLCNVTVRTVQYYDSRNILIPSKLTDGGRRLYSDNDLKKLRVICFLRNVGLSIDNIANILKEDNSNNVIAVLLEQQSQLLHKEIDESKEKLRIIEQLTQEIKNQSTFSIESIGDIALTMEKQKKLWRVRLTILTLGLLADVVQVVTLLLGILRGIWMPFIIGFPVVVMLAAWLVRFYYKNTKYICPECHTIFKPNLKEFFFASHTLKTRKLTCTECGKKGFCIETYNEVEA